MVLLPPPPKGNTRSLTLLTLLLSVRGIVGGNLHTVIGVSNFRQTDSAAEWDLLSKYPLSLCLSLCLCLYLCVSVSVCLSLPFLSLSLYMAYQCSDISLFPYGSLGQVCGCCWHGTDGVSDVEWCLQSRWKS